MPNQPVLLRVRLCATAVCTALLLAACGGGGGGSAPAPAPTLTPTPTPLPGSFADTVQYSGGATASVGVGAEGAAVVPLYMSVGGKALDYTATTGHLSATDARTGQAAASFFYVAYTAGALDPSKRPVTFFYNGGPGSAPVNNTFIDTTRSYIAGELRYTARSAYAPFNDIVNRWNFGHDGKPVPDTIPDLAAAISINPALKVVAMSGYDDLATPFHQTEIDLARLGPNPNVQLRNYGSGHMSYLDDTARRAQRADLISLLNSESVAK